MGMREMNLNLLPAPSTWYLVANQQGIHVNSGSLIINSIMDNRVTGSVYFNVGGTFPIQGYWDEQARRLNFRTSNTVFEGILTIRDEYQPRIRHFVLNGTYQVLDQQGTIVGYGTWTATTAIYY